MEINRCNPNKSICIQLFERILMKRKLNFYLFAMLTALAFTGGSYEAQNIYAASLKQKAVQNRQSSAFRNATSVSGKGNAPAANQPVAPTTQKGATVTTIKDINPKEIHLKQNEQIKVVVTGANFPSKEEIVLRLGDAKAYVTEVGEDRKAFYAVFNNEELNHLHSGKYPVAVETAGNRARIEDQAADGKLEVTVLRPVSLRITVAFMLLSVFVTFVIWLLIRLLVGKAFPLEDFILEKETNTYSLARFQFVWWFSIIVFGFVFLQIGFWYEQRVWGFVSLSNFAYAFLISLGTLVAAQGTAELKGSKGAGQVEHEWSDLVTHGGVIALERVQQLAWTIIIGVAYVVIIFNVFGTASSLPIIPNELLALMGFSAAGYIGGKAVRKAGPKITEDGVKIESKVDSKVLVIPGDCLSLGGKDTNDRGVTVKIEVPGGKPDNVTVPKDKIEPYEKDPQNPMVFCRMLKIKTDDIENLKDKTELPEKTRITVINADGQIAVYEKGGSARQNEPGR